VKLRRIVGLLLLAACANDSPAPPPGPPHKPISIPPPSDAEERSSVLNVGRGATVVSRTGEALLDTSALAAIDGDPQTAWMNPPGDLPQSVVVALPAKTRIDSIGIRSDLKSPFAAKSVTFEASIDGRTFTPLGQVTRDPKSAVQWSSVTPTAALFVRATLDAANGHDVRVQSLLARGRELERAREPKFDGCWDFNGQQANLFANGAQVSGAIADSHQLIFIDGGTNGRIARFEWIRGPEFGYGVMSGSPDGQHLSAVEWHEDPIAMFAAEPWFGTPGRCTASAKPFPLQVAQTFLQRTGRHSLYAIRFRDDDSIDVAASAAGLQQLSRLMAGKRIRIVAHEFREANATLNRARAQREIDALKRQLTPDELARVTFVAAGSDDPRQIPASEAARELYSTVDLEVER